MAVTDNVKSEESSAAGVMVKPVNSSGVSVQVVTPSTTLEVPALKVAPSGTPVISILSDSEPSMSVMAEVISNGIAESSAPVTSVTFTVGVSATPRTSTFNVATSRITSPESASVAVAVTVRLKSDESSCAGVIVRSFRSLGSSVQVPSPLSVPLLSVAPVGTPEITISTCSESVIAGSPSGVIFAGMDWPFTVTSISRAIAASSLPTESCTSTSGMSATPVTATPKLATVVAVVPSSLDVAVTVRAKSSVELAGGVTERPLS